MAAESSNSSNLRIIVRNSPPESELSQLGIKSWPKWGCSPGKYQLKFDAQETCYLLRGKVKVYPKNTDGEAVEFGAGDLVVIPKGLSCTWDVSVAVDKHYNVNSIHVHLQTKLGIPSAPPLISDAAPLQLPSFKCMGSVVEMINSSMEQHLEV